MRCPKNLILDFPHNGEYTREVLSVGLVWEMMWRIWRDIGVEWDGPDRNWNYCTGKFYVIFRTILLSSKRPDGVNSGGEDSPIWSDGGRRD